MFMVLAKFGDKIIKDFYVCYAKRKDNTLEKLNHF